MQAALDHFQPGRTIYLPGAAGESAALADALAAAPGRMRGVHIVGCPLPGINRTAYAALADDARMTVFLFPPTLQASHAAGRVRIMPLPYSAIGDYLGDMLGIDVALAHVAPPDANGQCSLGIAADFTPLAWTRALHRILLINPAMPAMKRGPALAIADADVVADADGPIVTVAPDTPAPLIDSIAARVAGLVPDGATIQLGLGGVPGAVWRHLADHRDLVIASGMVADGLIALAQAGALRRGGDHVTGVALGSAALHEFLVEQDVVRFATVRETHDAAAIALRSAFTAINSALEVDLFGQANLEWQSGRQVSGVGGAPDFARGAMRSKGGRSIIALPATAKGGQVSRIVGSIAAPTVSLARSDVDTVVTEHGAAELRYKSQDERAEALIAIAAPEWRERLASAWAAIRS